MFDMLRIGRRIAELRRDTNMTQMELSDRLGISHQAVSKWERGESMPDISTLPLLGEIFGVTVDDLLDGGNQPRGETAVLESVLRNTVDADIDKCSISLGDVVNAAPILKPDQLDAIAAEIKRFDIGELCGIAPFLSREVIDGLAKRAAEVNGIGELCGIAPFVSREVIDGLAKRAAEVNGIGELCGIAPFVSRDVLDRLAERAAEVSGVGVVCGIAPFISRETLDLLAKKAVPA
jgi:transcriptional regulator with XRE-family HTH domain